MKKLILTFLSLTHSVFARLWFLGMAVGFGWLVLLGAYLDDVWRIPPLPKDTKADAIIVLTGGVKRIDTGVTLLRDGHAPLMFISGVDDHVTASAILPDDVLCCTEIEKDAKNTAGNVRALQDWLRKKDALSLIIVTSDYHMPRVLDILESHHFDQLIIPAPVEYLNTETMTSGIKPWFVVFYEFHKYLYQRLTGITEI